MTGLIVSVFPFRIRVSLKEAFEGLELGEGKPSRPVLRGPGGRKAARLLGSYSPSWAGTLGNWLQFCEGPEVPIWEISEPGHIQVWRCPFGD
jgi:hypothetical protein